MNSLPKAIRSFSIVLLLVIHSPLLHAQQVEGQVLDELENAPLAYASVNLYQRSDSLLVSGSLSDSLGRFKLTGLKGGEYYLEVRFLGYQTSFVQVELSDSKELKALGAIFLSPSERLLSEIEIRGRKSAILHQVDRQIYDASQFQIAQGGTATEIVRNLPGVSMDGQGQISLRGSSGFLVMVDGRQLQGDPSSFLSQLPANSIQSIEILTTPSAKYDPDGKAGIINVITKQGLQDGSFIQVNGMLGMPSIEPYDNESASRRWGGDVTYGLRKGPWDLAIGLNYLRNDLAGRRIGYVNTYIDEVLTEFPSEGERSFDRTQYSGRFSLSYRPNKDQQLSLKFLAGDRTQFRTADILYAPQQRRMIETAAFSDPEFYWNQYQQTGQVVQEGNLIDSLTYYNENLRVREGDFLIGGIDYSWQISPKTQLTFSGLYERTILGGPTDNSSLAWPNLEDTLQYQFNTNENPLDGLRLKLDLSKQFTSFTLEAGYQYRFLNHPGEFVYLDRDLEANRWVENPLFTNSIDLERQIHSLYTVLSGNWNRLEYSAGLRVEYMDRRVSLSKEDTTYLYQILQPFPTLSLAWPLTSKTNLKAGYSRRIERTTTFKMTPFPEREHNETLEQGDATLLPEFIDLIELGLVHSGTRYNLFATTYFRNVQNVINRVNTVFNDTILNRIYTNAGQARALGLEAGLTYDPTSWWRLMLGGNLYRYQIQGQLFGDEINTANTIYSLNLQSQFNWRKGWSLQANFNYLSQRVTAQGRDSRFYNPNLTLRKRFNEKWSLSLQWQSIDLGLLQSNEQRITTVRPNFFTTTNYVYEVDRILLNLSFQLNQAQKPIKFIKSEFGEKEY